MSSPPTLEASIPIHSPRLSWAVRGELNRRGVDGVALAFAVLTSLGVLFANTHSLYNLRRLDILTFYLPWYEHLGERLRSGDLPGWIPYTLSGAPFAGDPQSGWGYLPAMVAFTISPSLTGYAIFLAFHLILASAGAYLYARVIGMRPIGALMVSVAFANGNLTERVACCTIHMQVVVWIPLIYLTIELALRAGTARSRFGWLTVGGIATGQMMSGWIGQGAYYGALAVAAYAIVRLLMHHRGRWQWGVQARQAVLAGGILALMSAATVAPALFPRLDTISRSNLADLYSGEVAATTGWHPSEFAQELFSYQSGTGTTYLGLVLLMLASVGAVACFRRPRVPFFVATSVIGISLIWANSPTMRVFAWLPKFEALHSHQPDRILIILFLPMAVLAGWLVDAMVESDLARRCRPVQAVLALACAAGLLGLIALVLRTEFDEPLSPYRLKLALLTLALVAVALFVPRSWLGYAAVIILIVMVLTDPVLDRITGRLTSSYTERSESSVTAYTETSPAAAWLQQQYRDEEFFRFFGYDQAQLLDDGVPSTYHIFFDERTTYQLLVNNLAIRAELQDIQGYNPVQVQRYVAYFDVMNGTDQSYHGSNVLAAGLDSPLLGLLGVRYIVVPAQVPTGRPDLLHLSQRLPTVYTDSRVRILEVPDAMPRAWIVHQAVTLPSETEILHRISESEMDPRTTVGLVGDSIQLEGPYPGATQSVDITSYEPDQIRLRVQSAGTGMVVMSEIWNPGWSATVDGESVEIHAANGVFRGIVVGPGAHEIVLTYKATLAKLSLFAWLIPILGLLALRLPIWRPRSADPARHFMPT